jgi:hypothetical protein
MIYTMKKINTLLFLLLPLLAQAQIFSYSVQSFLTFDGNTLRDSIQESNNVSTGTLHQALLWSDSAGNVSQTETYVAPDASTGIGAYTHGSNLKVGASSGNRFRNDSTYFEGTNGQSIPVQIYVSLDGTLDFKTNTYTAQYCNKAAHGAACQFVYINDEERFASCATLELNRNRLICLNCLSYEPEYTVGIKPKLLLPDGNSLLLGQSKVDSLLAFYSGLSAAQIADNELAMSQDFVDFVDTLVSPKSAFFSQAWVYPVIGGYSSYEGFEHLIQYTGYYTQWGLTLEQVSAAKLVLDYRLEYDIQDSIDLTATAEPFQFRYLFYSDLLSDGPCETELNSDFLNTFKIDSVRVKDGYFSAEVNFDSLFLVIAPGVKIPVKSSFQSTSSVSAPASTLDVQVAPNPAGDFVEVQNRGAALEHLNVFDSWGRVRYTASGPVANQLRIDLNGWPAGVYLLSFDRAGQRAVQKIVKR